MYTINIHPFHGFLGLVDDWKQLRFPEGYALCTENSSVLIGYSLGGRRALHELYKAPHIWKAAIFLSTHPGLQDDEEKRQRLADDEQWAQAFEKEPWDHLMQHWNAQSVFNGHAIERHENDYDRQQIADLMRTYSLGKQQDFCPFLAETMCPILWMTGENDPKFRALADSISFKHPLSQKQIVPNAAHRLLWENPGHVSDLIEQFLQEVIPNT